MGAALDIRKIDTATDLHAEQSVLGILLRNSEQLDVVEHLRPEHFLLPAHQAIYESIERLQGVGQRRADPISVYDDLRKHGVSDKVEGRDHLFAILARAGSDHSLETHAEIVRERALIRSVRLAASKALDISQNTKGASAADLLEASIAEFAKLSDSYCRTDPEPVYSVFKEYVFELDRRAHGEMGPVGIPTGFEDMDASLSGGGLERGKVYVIGARPSQGKTALALNFAGNQATTGYKVAFFTLEMPKKELVKRLLGIWGNVRSGPLAKMDLDGINWDGVTAAAARVEQAQLFIDDEPSVSLADITHKARGIKRRHGLDVLYVDYLQLMSGKEEKRYEMIGAITRGLKRLAKALNIAIVILSQLSRDLEKRLDKRPLLSDLRESGDIEQDADVVLMPYREVMDRPDTPYPDLCVVFIRKQRDGPLGEVQLTYQGEFTRFLTYSGPSFAERERKRPTKNRRGSGGFDDYDE